MVPPTSKKRRTFWLIFIFGYALCAGGPAVAGYPWTRQLWDWACAGLVFRYSRNLPPPVEEHDMFGVMARMRDGWRSWQTVQGYWEQSGVPAALQQYAAQFPLRVRRSVYRRTLAERVRTMITTALKKGWIVAGPEGFRRTPIGKLALALQIDRFREIGEILNEPTPAVRWTGGELPQLSLEDSRLLMEIVRLERERQAPVDFETLFEALADDQPGMDVVASLLIGLNSLEDQKMVLKTGEETITYTAAAQTELRRLYRFYTPAWLREAP